MILITTTDEIPGRQIESTIGLVRGTTVRARHLLRDVTAVFKHVVGGEIPEYTKLVAETREQAIDRMVSEAQRLGADAVVAFRFATSEVSKGASEVVAYGTAVKLRGV